MDVPLFLLRVNKPTLDPKHNIHRQRCLHCGQVALVVLHLASQHDGNTYSTVHQILTSVNRIAYFLQAKHVVPVQLDTMCTSNLV